MSKVKIFSVYFSQSNLSYKRNIKTDVIEPIQTGKAVTGYNLNMLSDDTGDNISSKNPYYGEITCWYWVWKNYLDKHPEIEYIGFTQYRRLPVLLPYHKRDEKGHYLKQVSKKVLSDITESYTEENIYKLISDYDLIVINKWHTGVTTRWQFTSFLPPYEWINARENFINGDETERQWFNAVMNKKEARYKCNFIMKRELFNDFCTWLFTRLFEYENKSSWKNVYPPKKENARLVAFITECFMNLWIEKQFLNNNLRIKEVNLYEERMYKKQFKDNVDRVRWVLKMRQHLHNVSIAKRN